LGRDPVSGKRRQRWVTVHGTKRDAEKKLAELLHQYDAGSLIKPNKIKLGDFLLRWLKDCKPNVGAKTAEGYEHIILRHLIPGLGNIPLSQIDAESLQHYYSEKLLQGRLDGKGGLSAKTVRHHHVILHGALSCAVKWGLLSKNPADAVTPPRAQRHEWKTLNPDDIGRLLRAAKETPYYELFYLAIATGMRRSELLALLWRDVDLFLCQIYVNRSLHHLTDGQIIYQQPKTAKGRRMIALSPSTALMLKEHQEKQKIERVKFGISLSNDDILVFCHNDGSPLLPDSVTHAWIKLTRRIGLRGIRLHDARHTHASLLLKQGVHPKIVQERLGHSTIQMTLDTYSHVVPGLQEAAAKRFDEFLINEVKKESVEKFG